MWISNLPWAEFFHLTPLKNFKFPDNRQVSLQPITKILAKKQTGRQVRELIK